MELIRADWMDLRQTSKMRSQSSGLGLEIMVFGQSDSNHESLPVKITRLACSDSWNWSDCEIFVHDQLVENFVGPAIREGTGNILKAKRPRADWTCSQYLPAGVPFDQELGRRTPGLDLYLKTGIGREEW